MNTYYLFLFYLTTIIFLESYIRLQFRETLISKGQLLSVIFGVFFASILYSISTFFAPNINMFLGAILILLLCLIFASQLVYYKVFRTFYITYSVGNAGDVLEFTGIAVSTVRNNLISVLIAFLPLPAYMIMLKIDLLDFNSYNSIKAFLIVLGVIFHIIGLQIVHNGKRDVNSPYNLYYNIHQPEFSVENLGLLTYIRLDIKRQLSDWKPRSIPSEDDIKKYIELTSKDKDFVKNKPYEGLKDLYNIMDIDFSAIAVKQHDEKTSALHNYFHIIEPSMKNQYTGIFKDYNLVFITAESFSHLAVREDITPTLYKMVNEGFNFKNFYTPIWGVSTTDGEYVATTGLLPKPGIWSFSKSKNNLIPFSLGTQLNTLGYKTMAYHNHTYTYYERQFTHTNMGYEYKGVGNGLQLDNSWPESDVQMMEKTIPEYINSDRFHTYYMTVSGHFRYRFGENDIADKNRALVESLPYSDNVKAYLATQIELDRALEYLLSQLEHEGVANKTLIAMSSDHYPYGLTLEELAELSGNEIETNFELYENTFILYVKDMEPQIIEAPTSSLDILPTISNLMGLQFDSRLLMGRDVFSDKPPLAIFSNRSFITDKGSFNSETGDFLPSGDFANASEDQKTKYRESVSDYIDSKFLYSAWMLDTDYYRKVLNGQ
ncbi:LTA synthase family protein [Gudongella sp. DL1XJH-153]|uniref:LTA synthase family protein n=1 Tax=Gudongella sp. DL1XJH-153 TaxID=3409804 RepID=UPI003BB58E58